MKKTLVALGLLTTMLIGAQTTFACGNCNYGCQDRCLSIPYAAPCAMPCPCAKPCPCPMVSPACPLPCQAPCATPCPCPIVSPACPCPAAPCNTCNDCCD